MDILWALLTLPYAPVRGFTAVVKAIQRQAEAQLYDPVNIRRELEEADRMAAAGQISEAERDRIQQEVLNRLVTPRVATPAETTPAEAAAELRAVPPGPVRRKRAEPVRRPRAQPVRGREPGAARTAPGPRARRFDQRGG